MLVTPKIISTWLPSQIWILISSVFLTIGDILLRSWFQTSWRSGFAVCFALYICGLWCMVMSFFSQNFAVATVAAVIINTIAYLLAAHYMYGDVLSSGKIIGIIVGLIAISLLEMA